jgi:hypothetical protein
MWRSMSMILVHWEEAEGLDGEFEASLSKGSETLSQKQNKKRMVRVVAQLVESLPTMCKALGLIPITTHSLSLSMYVYNFIYSIICIYMYKILL